jgi:hypothetical protein
MEQAKSSDGTPGPNTDRYIYVMPADSSARPHSGEVSLLELWGVLWRARWYIVAVTGVFIAASIPYALAQTEWYRADVLLAPAEARSTDGLAGQLGGLVALTGVRVGGGGVAEPLAILTSRDFTRDFIQEYELLPILFAEQWDAENANWMGEGIDAEPDMRDAIRFFRENILRVSESPESGMVALAVECWPIEDLTTTVLPARKL